MPEGHTIHRTAKLHQERMAGSRVRVTSPQGRFAEQAEQLDRCKLLSVTARGKHLFYEFRGHRLHVHLGLYGKFRPLKEPFAEPRGQVRLRMVHATYGFDLVGPNCCELIGPTDHEKLVNRLGQDPLDTQADAELVWQRVSRSRAALGRLLLDQSVFAGVGNIYRADALFHIGLHPETPGNALERVQFDRLWEFLRRAMQVGMKYNRIINTTPAEVGKPHGRMKRDERLLVYKKASCIRCDGAISKWELGNRAIYACLRCQPAS